MLQDVEDTPSNTSASECGDNESVVEEVEASFTFSSSFSPETRTTKRSPKKMAPPNNNYRAQKMSRTGKAPARLEATINKLHEVAQLASEEPEDQYDTFGKHIASQLRQLPIRSFILLQEKMQQLITAERLLCLDDNRSPQFSVNNINDTDRDTSTPISSSDSEAVVVQLNNQYHQLSSSQFSSGQFNIIDQRNSAGPSNTEPVFIQIHNDNPMAQSTSRLCSNIIKSAIEGVPDLYNDFQ